MQLQSYQFDTGETLSFEVSDELMDRAYNEPLIHQVVTAYAAAARQGSRAQKTRAQVRGGGKKPWRQKGTGRARAGSIRSPIWVGGGRAHPATPAENFKQKVNKKMYRAAMCSILSELNRQKRLFVVESLALETHKTKELLKHLSHLSLDDVLIITDTLSDNIYLAARNVYHIGLQDAETVDPLCLIGYKQVLVTKAALEQLEARLV